MPVAGAKFGWLHAFAAAIGISCSLLLIPATAGADWNSIQTISGVGTNTSQTRTAGDQDGNALVVWKRDIGGFDVIQGTKVKVDGTQGPIFNLSPLGENATDPVAESRADGSAMVAWINTSGASDAVQTISVAADGTLGSVVTRSAVGPAGQDAKEISIALGKDGSAGATWLRFNGTNWVVQAVRIKADGTSGTVHDLSDTSSSARTPDIAAGPVDDAGTSYVYRAIWPQGTGGDGNVYSTQITVDDTLTDRYQALYDYTDLPGPKGLGRGGDPYGVQATYAKNGAFHAFWVRNRTDYYVEPNTRPDTDPNRPATDPPDVPYLNDSVEWIQATRGQPLVLGSPLTVASITPNQYGAPAYSMHSLDATVPFDGNPVVSWVNNKGGGIQQVESSRLLFPGLFGIFQGWGPTRGRVTGTAENPVIAATASGIGASAWLKPSGIPGRSVANWDRFSNTYMTAVDYTPGDDVVYSEDVGFAIAKTGETLAAFTAIDGSDVSTTRIITFTRPGIGITPGQHNFGARRIGVKSKMKILIRNTGETTNKVTGITLSGPNASRFEMVGADTCVRSLGGGDQCQIELAFTPASTDPASAKVTVISDAGNVETSVTGRGVNQTRNSLIVTPRRKATRKGGSAVYKVRVDNLGGVSSNGTRICVRSSKVLRLSGSRCQSLGNLAAGASQTVTYRVKVTRRANPRVFPLRFQLTADNAVVNTAYANLRVKKGR